MIQYKNDKTKILEKFLKVLFLKSELKDYDACLKCLFKENELTDEELNSLAKVNWSELSDDFQYILSIKNNKQLNNATLKTSSPRISSTFNSKAA